MSQRFRSVVLLVTVVSVIATGCQQGVRAGSRCRTSDFGADATHVLKCDRGRWVRTATKAQVAQLIVAIIQAKNAATTTSPPPPVTAAPTTTTTPPVPPITTFAEGEYRVGTTDGGLVPGVYTTTGDGCAWGRFDAAEELVGGNAFDGREFLEVLTSDSWLVAEGPCVWTPAPASPQSMPASGDGKYRVGIEIQPGVYRTVDQGGRTCQYGIYSSLDGSAASVRDWYDGQGPQLIEITANDVAFEARHCAPWVPSSFPETGYAWFVIENLVDGYVERREFRFIPEDGPSEIMGHVTHSAYIAWGVGLWLTPAAGDELEVGQYLNVGQAMPGGGATAGMTFDPFSGCPGEVGNFEILSLEAAADGQPEHMTVAFEQYCGTAKRVVGFYSN